MDIGHETQQSVTQWGRQTFGTNISALEIAARMNMEVAELLEQLAAGCSDPELRLQIRFLQSQARYLNGLVNRAVERNEELACPDCPEALKECADVDIMLLQIASALGGDLLNERTSKMRVNRRRSWARQADGTMQHVREGEHA